MLMGIAFGPKIIAGFLPGAIVSGVQLAISAANTGGAWDNAKKYIEGGFMIDDEGNRVLIQELSSRRELISTRQQWLETPLETP